MQIISKKSRAALAKRAMKIAKSLEGRTDLQGA
jgi:hypothetical protein